MGDPLKEMADQSTGIAAHAHTKAEARRIMLRHVVNNVPDAHRSELFLYLIACFLIDLVEGLETLDDGRRP